MNVLLVHGFRDRGRIFRKLSGRLTAQGHRCWTPDLEPRDARHGLVDLAEKLKSYVEARIPEGEPLAVIGYSMGCLVTEYYLSRLTESDHVRAFFAISGPMHGTLTAWLYPGAGTRDMRLGSRFLKDLQATRSGVPRTPTYAYYTPLDLMIIPATSSRLPGVEALAVKALWHRGMLHNEEVAEDICRRLAGKESKV